jgi:hypothetical protein
MIGPYDTPYANRMALEKRLRNISQRQGIDLQRLRRRVAFERLLARLFADAEPPWSLNAFVARSVRGLYHQSHLLQYAHKQRQCHHGRRHYRHKPRQ